MKLYDTVYLAHGIYGFTVGTRCAVVEILSEGVVLVEVLDGAHSSEDNERRVFEVDLVQLSAAPVPAAA